MAKKTATKKAKPAGRPTEYSQATADLICERLADGKSLRAICRMRGMPKESTVRLWARDDREGFAAQYTRAREIGYELLADEILQIADTPKIGTKTVEKGTGTETTTADMIEHRRLQVDARKWMLAKMLPKRYGDKLAIGGADDLPPLKTLSDDDLAAKIAEKMAKLRNDGA